MLNPQCLLCLVHQYSPKMKKKQSSLYHDDGGKDDDGFDCPHLMEERPSPIVSDITVGLALPHQHLDLQIALLCFLDLYIYTNKYPDVKQLSCPSLPALAQPSGSAFLESTFPMWVRIARLWSKAISAMPT